MDSVMLVQGALLASGAAWVLWALGTLSVVVAGIALERFLFLRSRTADPRVLGPKVAALLECGDVAGARALLAGSRSTAAAVADAGLVLAPRGRSAAEQAMLGRTSQEKEALTERLSLLGTIGNNAPFVGLFGTVVGIVQAFENLGSSTSTFQAGQVASAAVMASLAEALVATAVGILVAIPAVFLYNALQRKVGSALASAEALGRLVLAYVPEREAPAPASPRLEGSALGPILPVAGPAAKREG